MPLRAGLDRRPDLADAVGVDSLGHLPRSTADGSAPSPAVSQAARPRLTGGGRRRCAHCGAPSPPTGPSGDVRLSSAGPPTASRPGFGGNRAFPRTRPRSRPAAAVRWPPAWPAGTEGRASAPQCSAGAPAGRAPGQRPHESRRRHAAGDGPPPAGRYGPAVLPVREGRHHLFVELESSPRRSASRPVAGCQHGSPSPAGPHVDVTAS